ncbi:MAG: hypothetical protein HY650_10885 [Acidobacteria bacterium]|nr:hypothetical protein [Acidobacteriota bacterium]
MDLFKTGRLIFSSKRSIEDGLGPIFNDFGCGQCHDLPAIGGAGAITETNFGRMVNGAFDPMVEFGGPVRQTTGITIQGSCRIGGEAVPPEATIVTERQSQPLFGLGLVENILESEILANVDPDDLDGDGISGRANRVMDPITKVMSLGRFGWKSGVSSILAFSATALLNEMGITTNVFPRENNPQGQPPFCDSVPDPEDLDFDGDGQSDGMMAIANFISFLGPPPRGPITDAARAGEALFSQVGCNKCHIPTLYTGDSPIAAFHRKPVNLYSDLLVHDMGELGDGIFDGLATGPEMRTAPLWGVRANPKYLHDARAGTLEEAILFHGGEAAASRDRFVALTATEKLELLAFLNSL